jgi:hypothetical protein
VAGCSFKPHECEIERLISAEQRAGWKLKRTARNLNKNDNTAGRSGRESAWGVNSGLEWERSKPYKSVKVESTSVAEFGR